jgi:hypothetical protein
MTCVYMLYGNNKILNPEISTIICVVVDSQKYGYNVTDNLNNICIEIYTITVIPTTVPTHNMFCSSIDLDFYIILVTGTYVVHIISLDNIIVLMV